MKPYILVSCFTGFLAFCFVCYAGYQYYVVYKIEHGLMETRDTQELIRRKTNIFWAVFSIVLFLLTALYTYRMGV